MPDLTRRRFVSLAAAAAAAPFVTACGGDREAAPTREAVRTIPSDWLPALSEAYGRVEASVRTGRLPVRFISYREAFGTPEQRRLRGTLPFEPRTRPVRNVVLHHAGPETGIGAADGSPLAWARAARTFHMSGRGWADIGYNRLVGVDPKDRHIVVIEGRSDRHKGAHVYGLNDGTSGLCLLADLESAAPTADQLTAVLVASALELGRYDLDPMGEARYDNLNGADRLVGNLTDHQRVAFFPEAASTCPGTLDLAVEALRTSVKDLEGLPRWDAVAAPYVNGTVFTDTGRSPTIEP